MKAREQGYGRLFWCNHVAKHAASGKTQAAYSAENGIKYQTLSAWVNKLAREQRDADTTRKRGRPPKARDDVFARVVVKGGAKAAPPVPAVAPMRLVFPGGIALEFGPGFDAGALAQLIAATGGRR